MCSKKIWDDCAGITNSAPGVPLLPAQCVRQRMGNWGSVFSWGAFPIIFPLVAYYLSKLLLGYHISKELGVLPAEAGLPSL